MNAIKKRMEERNLQKQVYSERERSTVDQIEWKDADNSTVEEENDACMTISKIEKSHSR